MKKKVTEVQMTKKKDPSRKTIDVTRFFISTRENEGVWFEPAGTGIEFKVLGRGADEVIVAGAEYVKTHDKILEMKDLAEQQIAERDAVCLRIAKSVKGIRGKDGAELVANGKSVAYSEEFIFRLMKENPGIRAEILKFSSEASNYVPAAGEKPVAEEKPEQE
jgi:hypothetical protein